MLSGDAEWPKLAAAVIEALERKDSRPNQLVNPIDDSLQDRKDCGGLLGDPSLAWVIEWAVKTIQIQV